MSPRPRPQNFVSIMIDPQRDRFGDARWSTYAMHRRAKLYQRRGLYVGTDDAGRHCYSAQQSALLLAAGARFGKGSFVIPWLVDGCLGSENGPYHVINLDLKQQDTIIAGLQVAQGRFCYSYNPRGVRNAPMHRLNPLSPLKPDSSTLIADAMLNSTSLVPYTDPRSAYFEGQAQRVVTAVIVTLAREYGFVTLPMLADKLSGLGDATEEWLSLEHAINCAPETDIRSVAAKLRQLRASKSDGGSWEGIKGEIQRNFAFALDPQVRASLSPPFDFDFEWLTRDDHPPAMVSIMEDLDFAEISAPVLRSIFTCALLTKKRELNSRPQFWCLQEVAALAPWPLAETLATTAAGYNIRTAYVVQSTDQLERLKKGASSVIPNSCGTQIFGGIRSVPQAQLVSKQLGRMTLNYIDPAKAEAAQAAKAKALNDMLFAGADPVTAMIQAAHQSRLAITPEQMGRDLRAVDECINEDGSKVYVFMPGVLEKPAYLNLPKYWQRRDLAGAYLGDPFHAKPGTVEIATWLGQRHREVTTEPAGAYADWPQYRDTGLFSYVKGFKP